jgi:AcrR family transcriptional regulator
LSASGIAVSRGGAAQRILSAARMLVARGGAAEISMGDVAASAGVSKALVHYHYHDKDSLLRALVLEVGDGIAKRARATLARRAEGHALDAYWSWVDSELVAGDVRVLISLAEYDSESVREASRQVGDARRDLTVHQLEALFADLGLTMSVPVELLAYTVLAFLDGLAVAHALHPDRNSRPAFDVFWLSLLTLAG